ncbi:hypothetical protein SCA03_49900 [Streptomyces cacaoi]|uniref:Uncharacterized protein n=1 Tax=Streptomyces cacaoi TaxID=1898 RepID=A0A4Y3R553_STRCI|nr:hypothetical protein SCA03_49900 [Streptomyces cacaoi]
MPRGRAGAAAGAESGPEVSVSCMPSVSLLAPADPAPGTRRTGRRQEGGAAGGTGTGTVRARVDTGPPPGLPQVGRVSPGWA